MTESVEAIREAHESHETGASAAVERDYTPAVYGSLLVTTLVAVQWRFDASIEFVALSLVLSVAVFWLTHVWASIINHRVHGPIGRHDVVELSLQEAPMLLAGITPAAVIGIARFAGASVDGAIAAGLVASIAQLFLWGLAVGRTAHSSWPASLAIAVVDSILGVAIVVLKVAVIH